MRVPVGLILLSNAGFILSFAFVSKPPAATVGLLLVANKGEQSLGIVDPEAGRQLAAVPEEGVTGHEVIASPDGRTAYVPIYGNSGVGKSGSDGQTLAVIDIATRRLVHTIDFGRPMRPHCPLFGPTDGLLYVTTELANSITLIDPKTLAIVGSVPTGQPESHMLVIAHDGKRGYTANVGPGTVSVLDLVARKTVTVIPISKETQRISISADDRWVFTADQTQPQLAVIDTAANQVKTWVALPAIAYGTAPTLDGRWLLVTQPTTNRIAVVDLESMKVVRVIDVGKNPQEIVVRPDNHVAYVSCISENKVAAVNLKSWKVDQMIDAGRGADGLAWASGN
jgi:DNA-binding beta-propeller fold protein YncE